MLRKRKTALMNKYWIFMLRKRLKIIDLSVDKLFNAFNIRTCRISVQLLS